MKSPLSGLLKHPYFLCDMEKYLLQMCLLSNGDLYTHEARPNANTSRWRFIDIKVWGMLTGFVSDYIAFWEIFKFPIKWRIIHCYSKFFCSCIERFLECPNVLVVPHIHCTLKSLCLFWSFWNIHSVNEIELLRTSKYVELWTITAVSSMLHSLWFLLKYKFNRRCIQTT